MLKLLTAAMVIAVQLFSCAKPAPQVPSAVPGELGLEFTGNWENAPRIHAINAKQVYPFIVRLTGYVPPKAYLLRVTNPWGAVLAWSPIMYRDQLQAVPIRVYGFPQTMPPAACYTLQEKVREQSANVDELFSDFSVRLTAEVLTQDQKVIVSKELTLSIECGYPGV